MNLLNRNNNFNILLAGILSIFIAVGIARFSFTSLLPQMLESNVLSLNYSGFLASINYIGYLLGAFFAIFINTYNKKVFYLKIGVYMCVLTTITMGITTNELIWNISRVIAGFGTAMINIVGAAIVMTRLNYDDKTKAMGIYFTGIGFAIILSDLISKWMLKNYSWEYSWIILGLVGFIAAFYVLYILCAYEKNENNIIKHKFDKSLFSPFVFILIFAYFTEGIGFVVQGTFLPIIVSSVITNKEIVELSWLLVGVMGIPSAIISMRLAYKYGSINIIILSMFLQVIGILIPTFTSNVVLNLLAASLYGITFVGLIALFLNLGGKIAKSHPVVLMACLTTAYSVGQIVAPLYSVKLVEITGNYNLSLYITATIVFMGLFNLFLVKKAKI